MAEGKKRAPRNRTLKLTGEERRFYRSRLIQLHGPVVLQGIIDRTICQELFGTLDWLPARSVDLLFADPPYNLSKSFNRRSFSQVSSIEYEQWLESWLENLVRVLKPTASVYICGDWRSSAAIQRVAERLFIVRNRITWEREKGRGAKRNWKNCSEAYQILRRGHELLRPADSWLSPGGNASHRHKCQVCTDRVSWMGLPDGWCAGVGADSGCEFKLHYRESSALSKEVDA